MDPQRDRSAAGETPPGVAPFRAPFVIEAMGPEEEEADSEKYWSSARVVDAPPRRETSTQEFSWHPPSPKGPQSEPQPSIYRIEWADVDAFANEVSESELAADEVGLVVHNDGEIDATVTVRVIGDSGTTTDYLLHEQDLLVAGKSSAQFHPDLKGLIESSDFEYAGHLRATAIFVASPGAEQELELARESSGSVFFHPVGGGEIALYNHKSLETDYETGDLLGQNDIVNEAVIEPTYTYRILGAGKDAEAEAMLEANSSTGVVPLGKQGQGAEPTPMEFGPQPTNAVETYTVCARWEIQTSDSNWETSWGEETEDKWTNANDGIKVPAYRVRMKIDTTTYDTDANGCVTIQSATPTHDVRVYEYVTNTYDTFARMHTGGRSYNSYPGSTYSWFIAGVSLLANGTKYVDVGDYSERTTGMAALGYALSRYAYGVTHSAYHVTPVGANGDSTAVHYFSAWPGGGDPNRAHIDIDETRLDQKFTVAHEYGHGFGGFWGPEEFFSTNYNYGASASACGIGGTNSHSKTSMEWSLDAVVEGWGSFVSAVVWNDKDDTGSYEGYHLESIEEGGYYGGREENVCLPCAGCDWDGAGTGTEIDWTLAFWDFYTDDPTDCSNPPSSTDAARFYGEIMKQGPGGGFPDHPYGWEVSSDAVDLIAAQGHIGTCFATRWYTHGYLGVFSISHLNGLRQPWD